MKPVYFPFTYIPTAIMESLRSCFRQLVVYQPSHRKLPETMQKWLTNGILDIRTPLKGDEEKLDAALNDFRAWINFHNGSEIAVLKTQGVPYFDDSLESQIRSTVKKKIQEPGSQNESTQGKRDSLFHVRVFLQFAQEYDIQNEGIHHDFDFLERKEQELIMNLRQGKEPFYQYLAGNKALFSEESGNYMISERLDAWARLMQHDPQGSALFITSSRLALEHLIEKAPESEMVVRFDAIPVSENRVEKIERWMDRLMTHLDMLAAKNRSGATEGIDKVPVDADSGRTVSLLIYLVPGTAPREFFARCIDDDAAQIRGKKKEGGYKNTLLGLIEK